MFFKAARSKKIFSIDRCITYRYKLRFTYRFIGQSVFVSGTRSHCSEDSEYSQALDTLSEKESKILQLRFGLNDKQPLSLKEIGEKFHLTKERIRQIEKKALQKLQFPSEERELEAYLMAN